MECTTGYDRNPSMDLTIDSRVEGSVILSKVVVFIMIICFCFLSVIPFLITFTACVRNNRNTKQTFCIILSAEDLISYNSS